MIRDKSHVQCWGGNARQHNLHFLSLWISARLPQYQIEANLDCHQKLEKYSFPLRI